MSEFTSTLLILNENVNRFYKKNSELSLDWQTEEVNRKWAIIKTGDEEINKVSEENLIAISNYLPVLYFLNAEDHKWGYKIYNNELTVSSYFVTHGEPNPNNENNKTNIEEFRVFKVERENIDKLKELLTGSNVAEDTWEQAELFKKLLSIEEISWIGYFIILNDTGFLEE